MSEKNNPDKKPVNKEEKIEQHKKSKKVSSSKVKSGNADDADKNIEKTGTKDDDWNDPTGNSHLGS